MTFAMCVCTKTLLVSIHKLTLAYQVDKKKEEEEDTERGVSLAKKFSALEQALQPS